ncbi:restriction endonuclease subunit S [Campylobacter lanienae]|uniref:restriction endonuclease subunit S n=2 Tax=Campylobacter lanienae TaxID=75658 RepID=UPI00112F005E|nr:restriction endonuclease subunit S [Campylobacter lanienae]
MSKQNIEFKDSGIPWIGEIPKHWEISKIKYVANLFTGNSISDSQKDNFTNSENSLPYIATKDIELDTNLVNYKNGMYIPKLNSSFKIAPKNSILLCIEGGSAGRKISFINKDVCFVNKLCCFVAKPDFLKKFLYYYCQNPSFISEFKLNLIGLIGGVSINSIKNFKIPLPPLNEQKEIAEFLDKKCEIIDKRLSNLERKIKSLKEYKKSLISECVTKGLNPKNIEFKDSGIPWIGQIPKHWEIKKVKYCFYIISGSGFEIKSQGLESGDYPVVKASDISKAGHYLYTSSNYINSKEQKNLGFKIIPKGSILMAKIGEAIKKNNRSIAMVDCCLDNNCQGLVPKDIKSDFAFYLFNCINSQWFDNSGTIPCINNVKLLNFKIPYPSIDEQKKIAEFLDKKCEKIDRLNENYTKQIAALKEYKKSLIYECVTGKNI